MIFDLTMLVHKVVQYEANSIAGAAVIIICTTHSVAYREMK